MFVQCSVLMALLFIPLVLSVLISVDRLNIKIFRDRRVWILLIIGFLSELLIDYVIFRQHNPISVVNDIVLRKISYQMFIRFFYALFMNCLLLLGLGILLNYLFQNNEKKRSLNSNHKRKKPKLLQEWGATSRQRKGIVFLFLVFIAIISYGGIYYGSLGTKKIHIVEICRKQVLNEEEFSYFIIENSGVFSFDLNGMYLSTDKNNIFQYRIENVSISSKEKKQIIIPNDGSIDIRKNGKTNIVLSNALGDTIDQVTVPGLQDNMAYRYSQKGWETVLINDKIIESKVEPPVFSKESGFYDKSFDLKMKGEKEVTIYYTLDGSIPTDESAKYTKPIKVYDRSSEPNYFRNIKNVCEDYLVKNTEDVEPVDKAFIISAIAMDENGNKSDVITKTYFINLSQYKNKNVVSLICDPNELFGPEGIYSTGQEYDEWYKKQREGKKEYDKSKAPTTNYDKKGEEWERQACFQLYKNNVIQNDQSVGIRIQGNSSRREILKRFSIYSRKIYSGSSTFDHKIFDNVDSHSLVLREGFNNMFSNIISQGRNVSSLNSIPVTVFINGELWYETYLQEKYDRTYFSKHYGVNKNNLDILKIGTLAKTDKSTKITYKNNISQWQALDYSNNENYEKINKEIDIQSYIDCMCINIYLANADYYDFQNILIWKTQIDEFSEKGDARWRWGLYDMDLHRDWNLGKSYNKTSEINSFSATGLAGIPPMNNEDSLFYALKKNDQFCRQFVVTFMDLINSNFSENIISNKLKEFGQDITYDNSFFKERPIYIEKYLEEEFGLHGDLEKVSLRTDNPSTGKIQLNTMILDLSDKKWIGEYYTDYPITLTALPEKGHEFVCWKVNGEKRKEKTIEVTIQEGGSEIYAIFK